MLLWTVVTFSSWVLVAEVSSSSSPSILTNKLTTKKGLEYLRNDYQSRSMSGTSSRPRRSVERSISGCMDMISEEGLFYHAGSSFVNQTCAIYIYSEPDEKIEIRLSFLDVPCENGGLIVLLDGWEMSGEIYPSDDDFPSPRPPRNVELCGRRKIKEVFRTTQNTAMIMHRMPHRSAGFRFSVRYVKNTRPCNALVQDTEATLTLRNYGSRSNCSITALFPAAVKVVALSVGVVPTMGRGIEIETGTIHKCNKRGLDDYVQIGGLQGMDTSRLQLADAVCGMDSKTSKHAEFINCGSTAVRLVSSGAFDNTVTVYLRQLTAEEQDSYTSVTCIPVDENMK